MKEDSHHGQPTRRLDISVSLQLVEISAHPGAQQMIGGLRLWLPRKRPPSTNDGGPLLPIAEPFLPCQMFPSVFTIRKLEHASLKIWTTETWVWFAFHDITRESRYQQKPREGRAASA